MAFTNEKNVNELCAWLKYFPSDFIKPEEGASLEE